ncbi:MAG: amino acid ABC transporter substrate-binding protein [Oscillibacter sp.]|nr:amino acid ABC transporter substrate-binding protein [Oscillibacter sp.]
MKKFSALLLALSLTLCLAGCGGGTPAPQEGESQAQEETAQTPDNDAASETPDAAATPDDAAPGEETALTTVSPGKLTMTTNAAFPPYEMTTDAGGFEGIDIEIAGMIAEKLGLELQIDDMDFAAALLAVQSGKSDIVMAGVTVKEDRLQVMNFSDTYATGVQVVIVPEGSDVTLDNLGEHMIGTQMATTGYQYCVDDFGDTHVTAYDNGITAVQALLNHVVDCVVIDNAPAKALVASNPGLTILDTEYTVEDYAIGVDKNNTALLDAINGALAELKADGSIQAVIDKYIPAE